MLLVLAATALAVLMAASQPLAAQAPQPAGAAAAAGGGEASLVLPDLSTVELSRHRRPHAADGRPRGVRGRAAVRPDGLHSAEEPARARVDARGVRADLRDVQDVPDHAGQVHPDSVGVHRRCCRPVLRLPRDHRRCGRRRGARLPDLDRRHHPDLQPDRHRGQLRRGVVRHPRQHVRQLARRVREPARASRFRSTPFRCAPA